MSFYQKIVCVCVCVGQKSFVLGHGLVKILKTMVEVVVYEKRIWKLAMPVCVYEMISQRSVGKDYSVHCNDISLTIPVGCGDYCRAFFLFKIFTKMRFISKMFPLLHKNRWDLFYEIVIVSFSS